MNSPNYGKRPAIDSVVIGYVQTMYFDLDGNYIGGRVEKVSIVLSEQVNWESESCKLIPYVWYEYTRVSKTNPETSRSGKTRIAQAKKRIELYVAEAENKGSVLKIIKRSVVIDFPQNIKHPLGITIPYLEDSFGSLIMDAIASTRKTTEFPPGLKDKGKGGSKKNGSQ